MNTVTFTVYGKVEVPFRCVSAAGQQLVKAFERINAEFYGPDAQEKFDQMLTEVEKGQKVTRILQEGIFLTAATAKYREKNYRQQSTGHAEVKMNRLIASFKKHGLGFDTLVMSTAWGECDEASLGDQTLDYLDRLLSLAKNQGFPVHSITLADTMGCATPEAIRSQIKRVWMKSCGNSEIIT